MSQRDRLEIQARASAAERTALKHFGRDFGPRVEPKVNTKTFDKVLKDAFAAGVAFALEQDDRITVGEAFDDWKWRQLP